MSKSDHNDRDYDCRYWWGDRSGSAVGVMNERCAICRGEATEPVPDRLRQVQLLVAWAAVFSTLAILIGLLR